MTNRPPASPGPIPGPASHSPGSLRELLLTRLDNSSLAPEARGLVRELLPGERARGSGERAGPVQLRSITAAGWRGIGPRTTLELPPGPGLVVVAGPNGSGKSSFAEAAETAITGRNSRWEGRRASDWQKGWRNLHSPDVTPEVSVELSVGEEAEAVTVRRTWYGGKVGDARTRVETADGSERELKEVVDAEALDLARPFLPYSELGSMINGTLGSLHNAFFKLLGLELLAEIDGRVKDVVSECDKAVKHGDEQYRELHTARAQLRALQKHLAAIGAGETAYTPVSTPDDAPESFKELLDRIADLPLLHFTGSRKVTLELDDQAYGSSWVRMTWDAALALQDFAEAAAAGQTGRDFKHWCSDAPSGVRTISPRKIVRDESKSVKSNTGWRRERTFPVPERVDPARKVFMGAHIRVGGGNTIAPRLHYYDGACSEHGIYIGYIGPHLTNTLT